MDEKAEGKREKETQINREKTSQAKMKHKKELGLRFSDVREAHATFLTNYLRQPEIDFLQGRVSANVFMKNYFNPALIGDLKHRTFKALDTLTSS